MSERQTNDPREENLMSSKRYFLTPANMAMLERVLADAGFRKMEGSSIMDRYAASFLTRIFLDGMTSHIDLTAALKRYANRRDSWNSAEPINQYALRSWENEGGAAEKHPARA